MSAAKQDLRQQMQAQRLSLSFEQATARARAASENLLTHPWLARAHVVALYAAVRAEMSTSFLAEALARDGKVLCYPRLLGQSRELAFHQAREPNLVPNRFFIPEPPASDPLVSPKDIDLFIVPGLAFDDDGLRLGWGRGYYDVTLRAAAKAHRVGLGFDFQRVGAVPADGDDEAMDLLATDRALYITGARPRADRSLT